MSRFFDAVRKADETRQRPRESASVRALGDFARERRPFRVCAVVSNKGGVGKTTVATNLAVYLRAMREDLPILLLGLDDQPAIDRMFAIEPGGAEPTIADALRERSLPPAIRLGQYGVHYVPTSPRISELKRELTDPGELAAMLARAAWRGLVLIDTKSDLEILTQNALAASDLALVLARDLVSVGEAQKVFDLLARWQRPAESARVLLACVDLRVKYSEGEERDVLSLLLTEIRRRGHPLLQTFLSNSPKIEALLTNPARASQSILHGAPSSLVHRQMQHLAHEVLAILDPPAPEAPRPAPEARPADPTAALAPEAGDPGEPASDPPLRPLGIDVDSLLGIGAERELERRPSR